MWDNPMFYLDNEYLPIFLGENNYNNIADLYMINPSNTDMYTRIAEFNNNHRYKTSFNIDTTDIIYTNLPYSSLNRFQSNISISSLNGTNIIFQPNFIDNPLQNYENFEYLIDNNSIYFYQSINMMLTQSHYTYRPYVMPYSHMKLDSNHMKNGLLADNVMSDISFNNKMAELFDIPFNKQSSMNAFEYQAFEYATKMENWYFSNKFSGLANNDINNSYDEDKKRLSRRWRLIKNQSNIFWQYNFIESEFNGSLLGGVFDDMLKFSWMYPNQLTSAEKNLYVDNTGVVLDSPYFPKSIKSNEFIGDITNPLELNKITNLRISYGAINVGDVVVIPNNTGITDITVVSISPTEIILSRNSPAFGPNMIFSSYSNKVLFKRVLKEGNSYKFIEYGKIIPYNIGDTTNTSQNISTEINAQYNNLDVNVYSSDKYDTNRGNIILTELPKELFSNGVFSISPTLGIVTTYYMDRFIDKAVQSPSNRSRMWSKYVPKWSCSAEWANTPSNLVFHYNYTSADKEYIYYNYGIDILNKDVSPDVLGFPRSNGQGYYPLLNSIYNSRLLKNYILSQSETFIVEPLNLTTIDASSKGYYPLSGRMMKLVPDTLEHSYAYLSMEIYPINTTKWELRKSKLFLNLIYGVLAVDTVNGDEADFSIDKNKYFDFQDMIRMSDMSSDIKYLENPVDSGLNKYNNMLLSNNIGLQNYHRNFGLYRPSYINDITVQKSPLTMNPVIEKSTEALYNRRVENFLIHTMPNYNWYFSVDVKPMIRTHYAKKSLVHTTGEELVLASLNQGKKTITINDVPNYIHTGTMYELTNNKLKIISGSVNLNNRTYIVDAKTFYLAPNGTEIGIYNKRIDLIYVKPISGLNNSTTAELKLLTGTPSVNPKAPGLPIGSIAVMYIMVNELANDTIEGGYVGQIITTSVNSTSIDTSSTYSLNTFAPSVIINGIEYLSIKQDVEYFYEKTNDYPNRPNQLRDGQTNFESPESPIRYYRYEYLDSEVDFVSPYDPDFDITKFGSKIIKYALNNNEFDMIGDVVYFKPLYIIGENSPSKKHRYALDYTELDNLEMPSGENVIGDYREKAWPGQAFDEIHHNYINKSTLHLDYKSGKLVFINNATLNETEQIWHNNNEHTHTVAGHLLTSYTLSGSIAGNTITFTNIVNVNVGIGMPIYGAASGTVITALVSSPFVYTVNNTQNVGFRNFTTDASYIPQATIPNTLTDASPLYEGTEMVNLSNGGYDLTTSNISQVEYINWVLDSQGDPLDSNKKWKKITSTYYLNNKPYIKENIFFRVSQYDGPINIMGFDFIPMTDSMDNKWKKIKYFGIISQNYNTNAGLSSGETQYTYNYSRNRITNNDNSTIIDKWEKYVGFNYESSYQAYNTMAVGPIQVYPINITDLDDLYDELTYQNVLTTYSGYGITKPYDVWLSNLQITVNNSYEVTTVFNSYDWTSPALDYSTSYPNNFNPAVNWYSYNIDSPAKSFYFNRDIINYLGSFKALTGNIEYSSYVYNESANLSGRGVYDVRHTTLLDYSGVGLTYIDNRFDLFRNINIEYSTNFTTVEDQYRFNTSGTIDSGFQISLTDPLVFKYTAGSYTIYTINAPGFITVNIIGGSVNLSPGHPVLSRVDAIELTAAGTVFYRTGLATATPIIPTPGGNLVLAYILFNPDAVDTIGISINRVNNLPTWVSNTRGFIREYSSITPILNTAYYDINKNANIGGAPTYSDTGSTNYTTTYFNISDWKSGTTYKKNDLVLFLGKVYIYISDTNSITLPPNQIEINQDIVWELFYKEINAFTNSGSIGKNINTGIPTNLSSKQPERNNVFLTGNKNFFGEHYPFWDTYLLQTNFFIDKSGLDRMWGSEAGYGLVKMKRVQRCLCSMYREETYLGLQNQGYEIHEFPKSANMNINNLVYFRNQKHLLNNRINPYDVTNVTEKEIDLKSATTINTVRMPISYNLFGNVWETMFQTSGFNTIPRIDDVSTGILRCDIGQNLNNFNNKFLINESLNIIYPFNYEFIPLTSKKSLLTLDTYWFTKGSINLFPYDSTTTTQLATSINLNNGYDNYSYNGYNLSIANKVNIYKPHGKFNRIN
jgi:hypothetical protein